MLQNHDVCLRGHMKTLYIMFDFKEVDALNVCLDFDSADFEEAQRSALLPNWNQTASQKMFWQYNQDSNVP